MNTQKVVGDHHQEDGEQGEGRQVEEILIHEKAAERQRRTADEIEGPPLTAQRGIDKTG